MTTVHPLASRRFDWRLRWRDDYYEHVDMSVIHGAWWRDAANSRKALVAVNLTDERQTAVVRPPEGFSHVASVVPVKGQVDTPSCERVSDGISCHLPPRSVGIFVFPRIEPKRNN